MKTRSQKWLLLAVLTLSAPGAMAQLIEPPDELPDTARASAWLDSDLAVQMARKNVASVGYGSAALAASPNEWIARVQSQQRRYQNNGANSDEWSIGVERTIRINGKAGLDGELGQADDDIVLAQLSLARHDTAQALATLWIDTLAAGQMQRLMQDQVQFAQQSANAVQKRQRAGDASILEVNTAQIELGEARRQASVANAQLAKSQAQLTGRFPQAQPPDAMQMPAPSAPIWPLARWREEALARNATVRIADAQVRKSRLGARRANADRIPDPTIGLYTATEGRGNERIVGLSLSIPLPGNYRQQQAMQALADSETARLSGEQARQTITVEVAQTYLDASTGAERWKLAQATADLAQDSARRTLRGYQLGEMDLTTLLAARRKSLDAAQAEVQARADALRARDKLLLDAYLIWDLDPR